MKVWYSVTARRFDGIFFINWNEGFYDTLGEAMERYNEIDVNVHATEVSVRKFTEHHCDIMAEKKLLGHGGEDGFWHHKEI